MGLNLGVVVQRAVVSFKDAGIGKELFSLPYRSIPLLAIVQVETQFNDSGDNLLSLGTSKEPELLASGVNLAVPGAQMVVFNQSSELDQPIGVLATYNGENDDGTAGTAVVIVVFATPFEPR